MIGILDSGIGGLTVLKTALDTLPPHRYVYIGDNANAPYGIRPPREIQALTSRVCRRLADMGANAILIACNTATAVAADHLRSVSDIPIIGMEPAVKPAARSVDGRVLVLATTATLSQPRFNALLQRYGDARCDLLAADGLVRLVENGRFDNGAIRAYLERVRPAEQTYQAVVLGCTHFIYAADAIADAFGAHVVDGNTGTVAQLSRVVPPEPLSHSEVRIHCGGYGSLYAKALRALHIDIQSVRS